MHHKILGKPPCGDRAEYIVRGQELLKKRAYVLIGTELIKESLNTFVPNEKSSRLGTYTSTTTAGETVKAFLPSPLPPDPPVDISGLYQQLDRANQALGRLDGLTTLLTLLLHLTPIHRLTPIELIRRISLVRFQIECEENTKNQPDGRANQSVFDRMRWRNRFAIHDEIDGKMPFPESIQQSYYLAFLFSVS